MSKETLTIQFEIDVEKYNEQVDTAKIENNIIADIRDDLEDIDGMELDHTLITLMRFLDFEDVEDVVENSDYDFGSDSNGGDDT